MREGRTTVWFVTPVVGVDPDNGEQFESNRHHVYAVWACRGLVSLAFYDGDHEVARWPIRVVKEVVWAEGTVGIIESTRLSNGRDAQPVLPPARRTSVSRLPFVDEKRAERPGILGSRALPAWTDPAIARRYARPRSAYEQAEEDDP